MLGKEYEPGLRSKLGELAQQFKHENLCTTILSARQDWREIYDYRAGGLLHVISLLGSKIQTRP
jgi:hypothetical protein